MERQEVIDRLNSLIQLDVDAVEAYEQAIKHVKHDDIRMRLAEFQEDHRGHIQNLTAAVRRLDGQPVKESPDLRGYLLEGFTALRSISGTKGALEAMESNEKLTNRRYSEAVDLDLPDELRKLVRSNLADEQRHIQYIEEVLHTPRREL